MDKKLTTVTLGCGTVGMEINDGSSIPTLLIYSLDDARAIGPISIGEFDIHERDENNETILLEVSSLKSLNALQEMIDILRQKLEKGIC
jgi:hypothetical protein